MASAVLDETSALIDAPSLDTIEQPWVSSPYSLISWWDMEKFSADHFFITASQLSGIIHFAENELESGKRTPISQPHLKVFLDALTGIEKECANLDLKVSVQTARWVMRLLANAKTIFSDLAPAVEQLRSNIEREMRIALFFHVPSKQAEYYAQKELFGAAVNTKFPSIQFDMVEAGNCYAMGRGTACVFHLMRIMEVGVQEFGTKLSVPLAGEKNWQDILNRVNKAIGALPPKDPATVELSQVSANLYAVKLAWRNAVMHPNDTYTLEEAKDLIDLVRVFMVKLAAIV